MRKVLVFSLLLLGGLVLSQVLPPLLGEAAREPVAHAVRLLTMVGLSFIMIHVGHELDLDRTRPRSYGWDYVVAATAAAFPWVFVSLYFVLVLSPPELWGHPWQWKEALLQGRFAAPTSAGVLFSMLAAAGLGATWVFKKARVLAIFDDLDTILLMIPLKVLMVGFRPQLLTAVLIIGALLWVGWRWLHALRLPYSWPWVMAYAVVITAGCEAFFLVTGWLDPEVPVHLEVLLPAFVLGGVMRKPEHGLDEHDGDVGTQPGPDALKEQRVATWVSGAFMLLVGLSMPLLFGEGAGAVSAEARERFVDVPAAVVEARNAFPGWGMIAVHVVAVTLLSNLGKMFPLLCYRREATWRERLALCLGMFPRGEVGAGVLVVSLGYGIGGPATTVALLSLALNLLLTGLFIIGVKRLLVERQPARAPAARNRVSPGRYAHTKELREAEGGT
ncbi:sodium:proton antiporter [Myxococcus sp. RHSTA-1-4]|uniref:sodium:proton antiporter n=1 Tax=Myxococcus sp. RHSTA-1-4 TaxID=2874601 RepID=UPI001CBB1DA4|nr:sodium:proton antiporter [Myxococcus sp. RHSTA-1-4]MBZ4417898.1 sodium:proton antiporter [Myxococcus sp. RHSTA-1-4]